MVRRVLLVALAFTLLTVAPAAAQSYSDVLGTGDARNPTVRAAGSGGTSFGGAPAAGATSGVDDSNTSGAGGDLARTGSSTAGTLAAVATALIGSGLLLVVMARRRSTRAPLAA